MAAHVTVKDPVKPKQYFETNMACTTGPVELERMIKNQEVNVVDVRAYENFAKERVPGA